MQAYSKMFDIFRFLKFPASFGCLKGQSCVYTDTSVLVMLNHQIRFLEAHRICTKSKDPGETLAIITNTNNKQIMRDIEVKYQGRYQFGRIFNRWLPAPYEITGMV